MAKRGASKNYDFGQKNHWRRTMWNEVLRRTNGREKSELVLYLAGPDDMDRAVATAKGVPSINMVAIDRTRATVQSIRSDGNPAVCGDIVDVLTTWPKGSKVCAIILDFCQGFQKLDDLRRIVMLTGGHPALSSAVIAVNMQRGRDAESNQIRQGSRDFIVSQMPGADPKHRGLIFALWYIGQFWISCGPLTASGGDKAWWELFQMFAPKTFSYSSGDVRFDSVVITSGGELFYLKSPDFMEPVYRKGVKSVALSTAATLAVRTRRLNDRATVMGGPR